MQRQPTDIERRLVLVETRIAELERKEAAHDERDIALLARIDGFIDDLRRIERVQMRAFEELKATQHDHGVRLDHVERNVDVLVDTAKDHKQAIERVASDVQTLAGNVSTLARDVGALAQGQTRILALLTGQQQKPND